MREGREVLERIKLYDDAGKEIASPWRDIVETNADNITSALDDLIAALQELRASTTPESGKRLEQMFMSAARWKGVLEHS